MACVSSTGCKDDLRRIEDLRRSDEDETERSVTGASGVGATITAKSGTLASTTLVSEIGCMDDLRRLLSLTSSAAAGAGASRTGAGAGSCVLEAMNVAEGV